MAEDEYDITPHHELAQLRSEIEELKKHSIISTGSKDDLKDTVKDLTVAIRALINLFHVATQEIENTKHKGKVAESSVDPLIHKINTLVDQNKKIAAGIVSVADMVKEKIDSHDQPPSNMMHSEPEPHPSPSAHVPDFNPPTQPSFDPTPPPSMAPPPSADKDLDFDALGGPDFPPPPPDDLNTKKKKGLFGK